MSQEGYIQGAGDDSEGWSSGLTPATFWNHREQLLGANEAEIPVMINNFTALENINNTISTFAVRIAPTYLCLGTLKDAAQSELYDGIVICDEIPGPDADFEVKDDRRPKTLHLRCGDGKLGSRALRFLLPRVTSFVTLNCHVDSPKILFACPNGRDLSVGLALAVLCLFFDDECKFHQSLWSLILVPNSRFELPLLPAI